jgi:hypothetical protein
MNLRILILLATVALVATSVSCKKKSSDGGGNPPPSADGGDGPDGGDTDGGVAKDFDFAAAGVLALSFGNTAGELSNGANLANYQTVAPPVPVVATVVENATPGNILVSGRALATTAAISCAGVQSANHAHWFACKAINDGAAGYPAVLEKIDSRLARISQVGARGAMCFESARTTLTIEENGLSIPQELSCWDQFQSPSTDGMAFGYSDEKVWMRLSDSYGIATVDIDATGAAETVDVWSVGVDGSDSQLTRVKSGANKVEITAAGSNLNAHYSKGVQVLLDKDNDMMYMRYICDAINTADCAGQDIVFSTFCTDISDGLIDAETCPGSIPWTLPMLVIDDASTTNLPNIPDGAIRLAQADIDNIGDATRDDLSTLMSLRLPSPIATLRDTIFSTSSTSLEELLKSVDADLTKVEGWITNDPAQCLVEVPKVLDITTPVDLNMPLLVSCQPKDDQGWTVYGQANGTTNYASKYDSDKSGSLISFDANSNMNAWIIRPYINEEMVYQVAVSGDNTAELTGMKKGGDLACGVHYKTNGTYFFVRSTFDQTKCETAAPAEIDVLDRCVNISTLKYVALTACQEAGLDIFTLKPITPQAIAYSNVSKIMPAAPELGTSNDPVNTTFAPPIALIPLPESGDGTIEVVPVRTRNLRIPKISGGGINYGRNCRHTSPVGSATADGVYELPLSDLSAENLTALQAKVEGSNAFVSFNFAEDLLKIGDGATASRDLTLTLSLLDAAGVEMTKKVYANADLTNASFVTFSMLVDQTLLATQKIRATLSGSATVACAGSSGQAHISAGIEDLRIRF